MKRTLLVLLLVLVTSVSGATTPTFERAPNVNGSNFGWDLASSTWRAFLIDSLGRLTVNIGTGGVGSLSNPLPGRDSHTATDPLFIQATGTASLPDPYARVGRGVTTSTTTSLTVPTVLTGIATLTQPCLIEVSWTNPVMERDATTTAATYATTAHTYASAGEKSYLPGSVGWDRGFLATGSVGVLTVTVWPLVP